MTTNQHRSFLAFAVVLITALSSCTVPTTAVTSPGSAKVTLQAHQARLVFQVGQARSLGRALTDAGYLTVEMRSVADGTVKADDAVREADGSYQVSIDGLVAGDWKLKVRLYADISSSSLLYYADVVHYVAVGTPTAIALKVYEPSSLTGGTITLADKVESVEVEGRGQPWGDSLSVNGQQNLVPGESVQLHAVPMSTTVPATDDRVTFTSDDPEVVEVTAAGRLKARGVGQTTIHITTVEGRKTASIPVKVEEAIVGVWESGSPRSSLLVVQRSLAGLEARLVVGLAPGAFPLDHKRGLVTRLPDGSFQAVLAQNLQLNASRTALVWGPNTNNTESYNLYPLPDGKLAVTDGDQLTFTRVANYLPVASLAHNPVTPDSFTVLTNRTWALPSTPWVILDGASGTPTVPNLFWWVQDVAIGSADPLSGLVTLGGTGSTFLRAASLDNPELGQLAWPLTAAPVAPSLGLADLAIAVPSGYVTDVPSGDLHKLSLRIRVAFDPGIYRYYQIQRWNSSNSTWQNLNGGTDVLGLTVGDWFDNYVSVTPGTEEKFRVITKASSTTGITTDSAPSEVITGYAPDTNGNPIIWESPNVVPGVQGNITKYQGFEVPTFNYSGNLYRSRWFTNLNGTAWYSHVMYSLRWGGQVWWIYSDPQGSYTPSTWVVGRTTSGTYLDALPFNSLKWIFSIGTVAANGRTTLTGAGGATVTLQWNSGAKLFEEYNP